MYLVSWCNCYHECLYRIHDIPKPRRPRVASILESRIELVYQKYRNVNELTIWYYFLVPFFLVDFGPPRGPENLSRPSVMIPLSFEASKRVFPIFLRQHKIEMTGFWIWIDLNTKPCGLCMQMALWCCRNRFNVIIPCTSRVRSWSVTQHPVD